MTPLDALLPLASTFIGALITYVVNIRFRRRSYVEDLFNRAIAAVAAAESSIDYLSDFGRPRHLGDEEYADLQKWMVVEGLKNWSAKVAAANEALASALPFQPALADMLPYRPDAANRRADEVIAMLKRGPAGRRAGIAPA